MSNSPAMLLKGIALIIAGLLTILLLFLVVLQMMLNAEVTKKIRLSLEARYPGKEVFIRDEDEGPLRQFCYELRLKDPAVEGTTRRFAMISGDDDGGTWWFGREYASMQQCRASYNRG